MAGEAFVLLVKSCMTDEGIIMRKIVVFNRISIDGFFTGPNGEIDWFIHDPKVDQASHQMMHPDTILFGRKTYQMFESYWPQVASDPNAPQEARMVAEELNEMTKIVFSKSLKGVTWENTQLVSDDLVGEVRKLKSGDGPDITIFGSGTIVNQLANEGLIDEYLLTVTPVILGKGKTLFGDGQKSQLRLLQAKGFASGNVLLQYRLD